MSKTLFTAALAFVLSISGFVLSAQVLTDSESPAQNTLDLVVNIKARYDVNLKESLAVMSVDSSNKSFGYKKNGTEFVPLSQDMKNAANEAGDDASATTIALGTFQREDELQFGYGDDSGFVPIADSFKVASDAGFHAGYNIESFYHLDFSKDPFDGIIDIMIIGEPLPASTVTMLVALAAAAALLLYSTRRTRSRFSAQA